MELHHQPRWNPIVLLKYLLGIEVARNASWIYLCQRKFALDIIIEAELLGSNPESFPMDKDHQFALVEGAQFQNRLDIDV